jgi:hypothetical protein
MRNAMNGRFGDAVFVDLDSNDYLRELYGNILYNYSVKLFGLNRVHKPVNVEDALSFADILSKSTHPKKSDFHRIWAQEMVALLNAVYPEHPAIGFYLDTVLSSTGNFQGLAMLAEKKQTNSVVADASRPLRAILDRFYVEFSKDFMSIPAAREFQFFRSQKAVYDRLGEKYLSYSGPTSMGKSFVMRMYVKEQIMNGATANFALLVPTKALINEVTSKIINDLKELLSQHDYRLVTSAGAAALKEKHNFIFVLTPERLLYLLIGNADIDIDYLFVDEAHKISSKDSRSAFYYKVVDMLSRRGKPPHVIFASPNIPNPEVYLKLIPNAKGIDSQWLSTSFAPVSQVKYLIDYPNKEIQLFNAHTGDFIDLAKLGEQPPSLCRLIDLIGADAQNIVYCSSTAKAVELARECAAGKPVSDDKDLLALSRDIKGEVHGDYYLAEVISKGVAYHIGYLPSAIRMRIEELFKDGKIHTMFCTSTLVEGVNLPADNLFITNYKNGLSKMTTVDFKNLIGRVGRIEYNLYGNVFLVRLEDNVKKEEFVELLKEEVPEQKLSIVTELSKPQKKLIVETLLKGDIELLRHPKAQTNDEYALMRKFALILLRDITKGNNSLVRREFAPYLPDDTEERIKAAFKKKEAEPDDDINVSVDQTNNLTVAIAKGLKYPALDAEGNVNYDSLMYFLEQICGIFKWEKYEQGTLGNVKDGIHGKLRWYAVILSQWVKGTGLSFIMESALQFKRNNRKSGVQLPNRKIIDYDDSISHRNIVISETLGVIENVILFSVSNYFLRFSTEYKRFHGVDSFPNDWYEYVEYGTTNPLSIMLQRNGFSRETSTYIRQHKADYVVMDGQEVKLRKSLAQCPSVSVRKEVADIQYNIPELFID